MIKQKYMGNIDWGCVLSITKVMFIHVSASDTLCGNESNIMKVNFEMVLNYGLWNWKKPFGLVFHRIQLAKLHRLEQM